MLTHKPAPGIPSPISTIKIYATFWFVCFRFVCVLFDDSIRRSIFLFLLFVSIVPVARMWRKCSSLISNSNPTDAVHTPNRRQFDIYSRNYTQTPTVFTLCSGFSSVIQFASEFLFYSSLEIVSLSLPLRCPKYVVPQSLRCPQIHGKTNTQN